MRLSQLLTSQRSGDGDRSDLLAYAGYTNRLMDGVYSLLPLGHRVLQRIAAVVRREMSAIGAQEVSMPLLQPEELWQRRIGNGDTRADSFGSQLFRIRSHDDKRMILAPTHEEVAALVGALCIRDVRDLPRVFYQIQPRFRDQSSATENGLLQTREFVMADAYSFHSDRASLNESYAVIKEAFCRIATACGVHAEVVSADAGVMGGEESEELVAVLPNSATTAALRCSQCSYAAGIEIAEFARARSIEAPAAIEEIAVPDGLSADGVAQWLGAPSAKRLTWTPFVTAEGRVVLAVLPGDSSLNAVKLLNALSRSGVSAAELQRTSAEKLATLGMNYESISLVRTPPSVVVIADEAVRSSANFFIPSTRSGHFLINVNAERDFRVDAFADLAVAYEGAACAKCGGSLRAISGIELGHIFKLGNRYTAAFGAEIASPQGTRMPLEMGCYGLGITRLMAIIVEQQRDDRGIVWPESVAPFQAIVLPLSANSDIRRAAEQLYGELSASRVDVLLDDSGAPAADAVRYADLIGIPWQMIFSESVAADGSMVEIRERKSGNRHCAPTQKIRAGDFLLNL